jgi:hypothetical protein
MKMSKYFFLGLLSLGLVFTGCDDDDDDDNNNPGTCAAVTDVLVDASDANSVTLSWTSTGSDWTIEYGEAGFSLGSGTQVNADSNPFTVDGLMGDTDYDFYVRNNCADNSSAFTGPLAQSTANPIVGTWEAYDVSPVLAGLGITAVTAEFNGDQTYSVTSSAGGAATVFEGTYSVSSDPSNGIYAITLNQTVPNSLTSEGIYEVYTASPDSMWYEVAQVDPVITGVTAPTVSGGFGSTSGGAFGNTNIQKYLRVE